jgi:CheY-like chemotaxis protein
VSQSFRVLVVDDNIDAANSLAVLLRQWGYSAKAAYTGQTAIDIAVTFQPHAIILDIAMPGMHGGKVAAFIREQPAIRSALIVAASGHELSDCLLDDSRHHFDHFIGKPCDLTTLENLLAGHAAGGAF